MPAWRMVLIAALAAAAALILVIDRGLLQAPDVALPPVDRREPPKGKGFDFYVLSLSWSPSYCAAGGEESNRQQCASGRAYGFIVHGLWPQFERGYPMDCPTDRPTVPDTLLRGLYDLIPSAALIRHQWRKHGSCSGLDQQDYFAVLRAARERITLPTDMESAVTGRMARPEEVEAAFAHANPGLPEDGIAVTCDRRYLREVRICMTTGLAFRSCPEVDRRGCTLATAEMPPASGS